MSNTAKDFIDYNEVQNPVWPPSERAIGDYSPAVWTEFLGEQIIGMWSTFNLSQKLAIKAMAEEHMQAIEDALEEERDRWTSS